MQISSRIITVRYECFIARLYLIDGGKVRRRLIINDEALQDHLKKPCRSDWPCDDDYEPYDYALVKKHTLEKLKAVHRMLPAELKRKNLPAAPITKTLIDNIRPRIGTLVSFGHYGIEGEFAIDLIDQITGELVRMSGDMLGHALTTSGAARNELINVQLTHRQDAVITETQHNDDGQHTKISADLPINYYDIKKLEKTYVQQANTNREHRSETGVEIYDRATRHDGSESSHFDLLEEQNVWGLGEQNDMAQAEVFREVS